LITGSAGIRTFLLENSGESRIKMTFFESRSSGAKCVVLTFIKVDFDSGVDFLLAETAGERAHVFDHFKAALSN
jgi:hypothetical protein